MKPLPPLLLALALTACRTPDTAAPAGPDWEPLASATSPCGRYTLRLERAEWTTDPGRRPSLSLQFALRTGEPDALLCGTARVTDLVPPDGTEFREEGLKGTARVDSRWGNLLFHGLEVYDRADRLRRLRVECRVMRVLSWRSFPLSCPGPGEGVEFLCPPYHVAVSGGGESCSVAAWCGEDVRTFPPARQDLFGLLGHDWVAGSIDLEEAGGGKLVCMGGAGTGGASAAEYRPDEMVQTGPIRLVGYPVRGTLRLPDRYVVEVVPFEFADCPL